MVKGLGILFLGFGVSYIRLVYCFAFVKLFVQPNGFILYIYIFFFKVKDVLKFAYDNILWVSLLINMFSDFATSTLLLWFWCRFLPFLFLCYWKKFTHLILLLMFCTVFYDIRGKEDGREEKGLRGDDFPVWLERSNGRWDEGNQEESMSY